MIICAFRGGISQGKSLTSSSPAVLGSTRPRSELVQAFLHPTAAETRKALRVKQRLENLQRRCREDVSAYYLQLEICYLTYPGQIQLVRSNTLTGLLDGSVRADSGGVGEVIKMLLWNQRVAAPHEPSEADGKRKEARSADKPAPSVASKNKD